MIRAMSRVSLCAKERKLNTGGRSLKKLKRSQLRKSSECIGAKRDSSFFRSTRSTLPTQDHLHRLDGSLLTGSDTSLMAKCNRFTQIWWKIA